MGKKKQTSSLGRTLIKDRFGGKLHRQEDSHLHTSELEDGMDWNRINLQSVTEQNTLDEFLSTAQIAGTEFQAERLNVSIVQPEKHTGLLTAEEERVVREKHEHHRQMLRIPRRPQWTSDTTPAELDRAEKDSFLEWRRQLAELQATENIIMTPFERNLDFWRQLWRVIERSDVVVQIVDARNPLLFHCEDLAAYVKEIDDQKINVLLLNKADFLSDKQRQYWAEYYDSLGVKVAFWSAVLEAEKQKAAEAETVTMEKEYNENESESESESEDVGMEQRNTLSTNEKDSANLSDITGEISQDTLKDTKSSDSHILTEESTNSLNVEGASQNCDMDSAKTNAAENAKEPERDSNESSVHNTIDELSNIPHSASEFLSKKNNPNLLDGDELIALFKVLHDPGTSPKSLTTIGLVGYPNVGKSSTINALLQTKKVPVSATPGRTKHFQTLYLDKTLMLCDCPGLVMPMFVSTKAEMIICGILPVDQMRDYIPPLSLVVRHIPRSVLEASYGIMLPKPRVGDGEDPDRLPTAHELLTSYACMRGFMTHKGVPDFQRASRNIIKDYINGRLLYCHPPNTVEEDEFEPAGAPVKEVKLNKMAANTAKKTEPSSIDAAFFEKDTMQAHSKGVHGVTGYARRSGFTTHVGTGQGQMGQGQSSKPWKRHGNRNKKEKLRRIHGAKDVT